MQKKKKKKKKKLQKISKKKLKNPIHFLEEGNGNSFQYGLKNPMDRGAW